MKELQAKLYSLTIHARHFRAFNRPDKQDGATAIEYALIAAVMVGIIVAAFEALGLTDIFQQLNTAITDAIGGEEGGG